MRSATRTWRRRSIRITAVFTFTVERGVDRSSLNALALKDSRQQRHSSERHRTAADLGQTAAGRGADRTGAQAESDAGAVQQGGGRYEAETISEAERPIDHFAAMRVPMKDGEECRNSHRRKRRHADLQSDRQSERDDGKANSNFHEWQWKACRPQRTADRHDCYKADRHKPKRATAEVSGQHAYCDHREHMVDTSERMREPVNEIRRSSRAGMSRGSCREQP